MIRAEARVEFLRRPVVVMPHKLRQFRHRNASLGGPDGTRVAERIGSCADSAPFTGSEEGLFDAGDPFAASLDDVLRGARGMAFLKRGQQFIIDRYDDAPLGCPA